MTEYLLQLAAAAVIGAEHLGEALLHLLTGEDGWRGAELLRRGSDAGGAVDELFCGLQEDLGGRLAGVHGDEFDLAALLGSEFQFHSESLRVEGAGASIELW